MPYASSAENASSSSSGHAGIIAVPFLIFQTRINQSNRNRDLRERLWTLANGIMLLMFLFSAAVQLNDPDPLTWIGIYCAAATVCALEIRRRLPVWVPVAIAVIAFVWAGSLYFRARDVPISSLFAAWEMQNLRIEEAREMYGLAIVAVWMIMIVGIKWWRAKLAASTSQND